MKVILANPRGFCAGVSRAINIVRRLISLSITPIYVLHEIVHNKFVVDDLRLQGVTFVEDVNDIPDKSVCVFSAHGVSKHIKDAARKKHLKVYDATCPLVTKVHISAHKAGKENVEFVLIAHKDHQETKGIMGQYISKYSKLHLIYSIQDVDALCLSPGLKVRYATQTTLSVDKTLKIVKRLKQKYPLIEAPKRRDICYATQNRQFAVTVLAKQVDLIIIVGSKNSSNSNRLCEVSREHGVESYLVEDKHSINISWFFSKKSCGLTAGASAPEYLIQEILFFFKSVFPFVDVTELNVVKENVVFNMPKISN